MCVAIWFWTQPCLSLCVHILVHIHHIRILFQLDINYICSKLTSNWIRRIFWNIVRCCPLSICIFPVQSHVHLEITSYTLDPAIYIQHIFISKHFGFICKSHQFPKFSWRYWSQKKCSQNMNKVWQNCFISLIIYDI